MLFRSPTKQQKLKFSYQEQREYAVIDDTIAQLEEKISELDERINRNATDYVMLQQLTDEKTAIEDTPTEKMERWVYLTDLAERIEAQKG